MIKAEEIDGYRGCDDLDSILQFIEKGDEKKTKSGSKRATHTGRNRVESPSLSVSVSTKQRSKQNAQEKYNGNPENNIKNTPSNKKATPKRSQTPGEGRIGMHNTDIKEQTETPKISAPSATKDSDKHESVVSSHSNSKKDIVTSAKDESDHIATIKDSTYGPKIEEACEKQPIETIEAFEEEEDDDDTPFVMIRRVNNHSNSNKSGKGKAQNENVATQGKNSNLNANRNSNNRYANKTNPNSTGRGVLKRKSKTGYNELEEYTQRDISDASQQHSKPEGQTGLSFIKSTAPSRDHNDTNSHQNINNDNVDNPNNPNFVQSTGTNSKTLDIVDSQLATSKIIQEELHQSKFQDLPTSFSSVVQAKKGSKTPRAKPKNKGGNGLSNKQFIDAALNVPISSSKRHTDSQQQENNSSDTNKSKISNTFVAEAMLPEPVLEYSRTHSSHSPPPAAHESDDLRNEHSQQVPGTNVAHPSETVINTAEWQNDGQMNRRDLDEPCSSSLKKNDGKEMKHYSDTIDNFTPTNEHFGQVNNDLKYELGDNSGFDTYQIYRDNTNQDSMKITQCQNKYPKSYSSALLASPDITDVNERVNSNVSIMNVKNTRDNDSNIERISNVVQYENRNENDQCDELDQSKVTNPVCKTGLSTSTSPISSRSSSFTWYEEEDDLTEGAFNYTTILNFIKTGKNFVISYLWFMLLGFQKPL